MRWWRRTPDRRADPDAQPVQDFPELLAADSRAARAAVVGRIAGFTPDWKVAGTTGSGADAGVALVKVFGEQVAPVAQQANRLRDKYGREQLRIAGVTGRGSEVATVTLVFTLLETATATVAVPAGTQLLAPAADGDGQVVFETTRDLDATPARLAMLVAEAGTRTGRIGPGELTPATPVLAFGLRPQPGSALWLGFDGPVPFPRLSLGLELPAPPGTGSVVAGGVAGQRAAGEPNLSWELFTTGGLVPADVERDETLGLRQSGIVEVRTSRDWPALPHPTARAGTPAQRLRWLRVGLLSGRYDTAPGVVAVLVNAVLAEGAETVRDEILEPVDDPTSPRTRRFRLARAPVLRGSVRLVIDAPDPADLFDVAPRAERDDQPIRWEEVRSLARSKPYDRHFVLDEATGIVTFGDGVRGAEVPAGFRHVLATSYRTGRGRAGAVAAEAGFVPRGAIPFLAQVDNPAPAAGGADAEPVERLVARGPALIRARQRAVTPADVEVMAIDTGGDVGRVVALAGREVDGTTRPGQLTVVVVGRRRDDGGAPVPGAETLAAVARFLAGERRPVAPLGARVVVRPARFVPVQVEATFRPDDEADRSSVVLAATAAVDGYLDPLTGGADGRGWALGASIPYRRLVSVVAGVPGVAMVGRVAVVVGGRLVGRCRDAPLPAGTLPWPGHHLMLATAELEEERP
jgi:predicted phage baseplate assembly protein